MEMNEGERGMEEGQGNIVDRLPTESRGRATREGRGWSEG